jgi:hypothetical protein
MLFNGYFKHSKEDSLSTYLGNFFDRSCPEEIKSREDVGTDNMTAILVKLNPLDYLESSTPIPMKKI